MFWLYLHMHAVGSLRGSLFSAILRGSQISASRIVAVRRLDGSADAICVLCLMWLASQCLPIDACLAQSASNGQGAYSQSPATSPMNGPRIRRPGVASGASRSQLRGPVRTAATQIHDASFADEGYEQVLGSSLEYATDDYQETLAPNAMHYDSGGWDDCQSCGAVSGACHCQPFGWLLDWSRGDLWLGTVGFAGASSSLGAAAGDAGQVAGNFGFQEGFNFGTRLPGLLGGQLGSQLGMRFTQSQLDGTSAGADNRTQTFVTAGLFRRVDYGIQGGLVVDYLHDDWLYKADLLQLRGELSFLFSPCHDFGFRFTDSQQTDDTTARIRGRSAPLDLRLSGLNNYRFFYRARFGHNAAGLAELQAGWTEESSAILGANLRTPLQNQLGLDVSATYLLPPNEAAAPYTQAGWNLSLALVWTPGRCFGSDRDYYRPLLAVGDNGSFLTRHVSP